MEIKQNLYNGCQEHIKLQLLSIENLMSTQLSTKVCINPLNPGDVTITS